MLYIRSEERRRPRASFWHYGLGESEVYAVFYGITDFGPTGNGVTALSVCFLFLSLSLAL